MHNQSTVYNCLPRCRNRCFSNSTYFCDTHHWMSDAVSVCIHDHAILQIVSRQGHKSIIHLHNLGQNKIINFNNDI